MMAPRVVSKAKNFDFVRDSLYKDERMRCVMIKATSCTAGFNLFKALLKKISQSEVNRAFICSDGPIEYLMSHSPINPEKLMENFRDYFDWNKIHLSSENKLSGFDGFLCIYSLTTLIIQRDVNSVYKDFHKLLNSNPDLQIISLVYTDVHSKEEILILDSLASSTITVLDEDQFLLNMTTERKAYGEVLYDYRLSSDSSFENVSVSATVCGKSRAKKPDPTANLTFNLNLNDDEKEARSHLQLPFVKSGNSGVTTQDLEDDLFEEEDPDDDLGFLEAI